MKKLVAGLLGLVLLAVIIGIGAISFPSSSTSGESSTITDYKADFTVKSDGDLDAVETLTVNFPISRHGIFRFFDTRDPNDAHNRFLPEHVSISRDGQPETYERKTERRPRHRTRRLRGEKGTIVRNGRGVVLSRGHRVGEDAVRVGVRRP